MLPVWIYLSALFIAPQLWLEPFLGMRVDFFIYPLWLLWLALRGRAGLVFSFHAQDWFFAGFIAWMALGVVVNPAPEAAGTILQNYVKWLLMYRLTAASIDSPDALRRVVVAILVVSGVVAVEAAQHLSSASGLGWAGQTFAWVDPSAASVGVTNRTRWVGIFDGPGVFCVMFTVALPFALQYIAPAYGMTMRALAALALLPLFGYAIFTTGSRGGFLTAIAVMGFWVMSRFRITLRRVVLAGVIVTAGMMLGPSYLTSTTDSNKSAQHRVDMWYEGIEMVQGNPLFGIGRGNFAEYTGRLIAHNSGIEIMGETGLAGLFLWFGIIYLGFRNLANRVRETADPRERELLMGLGLALIGYIVSSLFVTLEYETLYLLLGMTAGVRNFTTQFAPLRKRDAKIMATVVLAFFVAMKLFVMSY
jgi:O-antigen ligase